jgi:hypothetical protein
MRMSVGPRDDGEPMSGWEGGSTGLKPMQGVCKTLRKDTAFVNNLGQVIGLWSLELPETRDQRPETRDL